MKLSQVLKHQIGSEPSSASSPNSGWGAQWSKGGRYNLAPSLVTAAFVHTAGMESCAVALQLYPSPSAPPRIDFIPSRGRMHSSGDYHTALSKPQPIAYNHSSSPALPNRNTTSQHLLTR